MSLYFDELDFCETALGALSLRRRRELLLGVDVYEIKLGDEFLMSSLFTVSEIALANLALAELARAAASVVVGGLGLGFTARAVLAHPNVTSLVVVEALAPVIVWHERDLLPFQPRVTGDPRCSLLHGDFFALATSTAGFDAQIPGRRFDAILLDIDHAPDQLLNDVNAAFYLPDGLRRLARHLAPGGVFGLWSNEPPDAGFTARLAGVFATARAEPVTFHNPLQDRDFTQAVYLART